MHVLCQGNRKDQVNPLLLLAKIIQAKSSHSLTPPVLKLGGENTIPATFIRSEGVTDVSGNAEGKGCLVGCKDAYGLPVVMELPKMEPSCCYNLMKKLVRAVLEAVVFDCLQTFGNRKLR